MEIGSKWIFNTTTKEFDEYTEEVEEEETTTPTTPIQG